ncbi:LOW QUALITY PROTEIN: hypothetical protein ACHAW6_000443, partial [Cyclotella cf. meneghiniana]
CKRNRLIDICHNNVHDEWAHLCGIALTDSQIVIEPTIFYRNGDHKPVQTVSTSSTQLLPLEPQLTSQTMKQEEMPWPMASGTKGEAWSSSSVSATWTRALMGTLDQAKSLSNMPRRKRTSTRQPALSDYFTPQHPTTQVVIEHTIFYGNGSQAGGNNVTPTTPHIVNQTNTLGDEARGDVLAHGFWNRGRGTVFGIRICNTDSQSYGNTSLRKILERHAKEKKDKYETACLDRRQDFTPLVYSVDDMASKDARTAEQRIAWLLAKKWSRTYSDMASFICTWMSLAIVPSNTLLLRGDRTSQMCRRTPSDGVAATCTDQ